MTRDTEHDRASPSFGCAGKLNKSQLAGVLSRLPIIADERLIEGAGTFDDASVFQVRDDLGLVSTVDVMDAIGEEYYRFGRVAAANALSDVYAMGGVPLVALNVVCTSADDQHMDFLYDVLRGAQEVVTEAGAVIGGGHTTVSEHFKFGLAVTGSIHPDRIVSLGGAQVGDKLILTKPLGAMAILNALVSTDPENSAVRRAFEVSERLNRTASQAMIEVGVNACTDVTGFGFLGHLSQMMEESGAKAHIWSAQIPILEGALDLVPCKSKATALNRKSFEKHIEIDGDVSEQISELLFEAVTSGGLLISVPSARSDQLLERLSAAGDCGACVGEVREAEQDIYVVLHS